MTSKEIRQSFLDYFSARDHRIVPSAPVIPHGDPTLLFTNAGMNQFKDVFLGTGSREYRRAADTQKCIRVSGKHNDLEEVGHDTYHHTFFEMLGNWSFGDYYKEEAIGWAWDLLTNVWKLPKDRLYATVYNKDDEAEEIWKRVTDIPHDHILRFGEKDNFWEMGETGPCGPCSEIHIDLTSDHSGKKLVNASSPEVIEIWNLVFIQHNRKADGSLEDLPAKHVDTGMGFERVCAVMQGKKSNYDSDVFAPIIGAIENLSGKKYIHHSAQEEDRSSVAMRVISDHIRTLSFAIADGALPGNDGRGYVLRRILRRAVKYGRDLGFHEPFLFKLVPTLVAEMSDTFPEIKKQQSVIERVVKAEEESFGTTLDRGIDLFEEIAKRTEESESPVITGEEAFKLYDTYGFPVDLTNVLARERGLEVDMKGFEQAMDAQRERSGGKTQTHADEISEGIDIAPSKPISIPKEKFTGYDSFEVHAPISLVTLHPKSDEIEIRLAATCFYAESGGQVGDTGKLFSEGSGEWEFTVKDTIKKNNEYVHVGTLTRGKEERLREAIHGGELIAGTIDVPRREAIMRNHTATHLVHAALRKILGEHVHQAGSLVNDEKLRFDFSHFEKVSPEQLRDIEQLVNNYIISEPIPLEHHRNIPFDEAKRMGALMFFGDKYGDRVNVVQFGEFSKEFCGGTHVKNTSEIGLFKFIGETSIASGVRRIEAVTGLGIAQYINEQLIHVASRKSDNEKLLQEIKGIEEQLISRGLKIPIPTRIVAPNTSEVSTLLFTGKGAHENIERLEKTLGEQRTLTEELLETKKSLEKQLAKLQVGTILESLSAKLSSAIVVNDIKLFTAKVDLEDIELLRSIAEKLLQKLAPLGVVVLGGVGAGKVSFVAGATDEAVKLKQVHAGKLVGKVAEICGGRGGGKPNFATAGGKDVAKLDEALSRVRELLF